MDFKLKIQQLCTDENLYFNYRKDRRAVLDQSVIKSGEYKQKKELELDLLKLKIRMQLYGLKSLNTKERRKLRKYGMIPSGRQNVQIIIPEHQDENQQTSARGLHN